jgi:hypothetical protein
MFENYLIQEMTSAGVSETNTNRPYMHLSCAACITRHGGHNLIINSLSCTNLSLAKPHIFTVRWYAAR